MVVKSTTEATSGNVNMVYLVHHASAVSWSQKTARRLIRKYKRRGKKSVNSYSRLKKLVPSISKKENISKLDVVLEAISYIQRLQGDLEAAILTSEEPLHQ